jgi:alpha-amylase
MIDGLRLVLALHNHQPVGNFDGVFEEAYRTSYLPFVEVLEDYPDLPFVLHTSGPLLDWMVERHPEYIARVRALVASGRVEILGGGYYEPILTMIPHRDRIGQIRTFADRIEQVFGVRPRGAWLAERVWEQDLASSLSEAGVEYTMLDDFHFHRAGLTDDDLVGPFLTEDEGRLLTVFPGSEPLRYMVPFHEPHSSYEHLRNLAARHPGSTVVAADDGEKFGSWPETFDHVYTNGWLRRFCDMLTANKDWLRCVTLARAADESIPRGKVYLPDSSYREMTEWALPPLRMHAFEDASRALDAVPEASVGARPFLRAGGSWRNFKARYPESDEMYSRMLGLSRRLDDLRASGQADPDALDIARRELYQGQCNCPYWHGSFGGLYLPHLRNAIYEHLIAAHTALEEAEGIAGPRARISAGDFNLDARKEVCLENDRLVAFVRPATGGHLYELDVRDSGVNLLATLDRRPEAYHRKILAALALLDGATGTFDPGQVRLKHKGLDQLLVYDRTPRKMLVDHVYPVDATLDDVISGRDIERGDFATGTYLAEMRRAADAVSLVMTRPGNADGHLVHVTKTVRLAAGRPGIEVTYRIDDLPPDRPIHFAVEMNIAGLAGHADDRSYLDLEDERLDFLDARLDLGLRDGLVLRDGWRDLDVALRWTVPAAVWCFPIETVSQSEGGFEAVYQSSAVMPHWLVTAGPDGSWSVTISLTADRTAVMPHTRPNGAAVAASKLVTAS